MEMKEEVDLENSNMVMDEEVDLENGPLGDFYDKMKKTVWIIKINIAREIKGEKIEDVATGTGVCIHEAGYILSALHIFNGMDGEKAIQARTFGGSYTDKVVVIQRDIALDLILLKITDSVMMQGMRLKKFYFASFATGNIAEGKFVATIGHPCPTFNLTVGRIVSKCPPCEYDADEDDEDRGNNFDIRSRFHLIASEDAEKFYRNLRDDIILIQVAANCSSGNLGVPLFDGHGKLIGILLKAEKSYTLGLHVSFLKKLTELVEFEPSPPPPPRPSAKDLRRGDDEYASLLK